uniref:SLC12A transporter C-terminal domain-containing protein n=1 Tax=Romanomermis culicivorax TaxID=13658 RepID=A0A915L1E2_ROMCU
LTLLIPHILANNKTFLSGAKLHIFTLASQQNKLEQEEENMRTLLQKFRIEFADITIIPDMHAEPQPSTKLDFEKSIAQFRIANNSDSNKYMDPKFK